MCSSSQQNVDSTDALLTKIGELLQQGLYDEAIRCCRQVLEHTPDSAEAFYLLGSALSHHHSSLVRPSASAAYQKAIALRPDYSKAYYRLVEVLVRRGESENALLVCQDALRVHPNDSVVTAYMANIHYLHGNRVEALNSIQPFLHDRRAPALIHMVYAKLATDDEERRHAVVLLERALANLAPEPSRPNEHEIRFRLGRLLDRLGEYDRAFRHAHVANSLASQRFQYSYEEERLSVEDKIAKFGETALQTLPRSSNKSDVPIFIIGLPRSGTTLVEQTLSAHPQVFGGGELGEVSRIAATMPHLVSKEAVGVDFLEMLTPQQVDEVAHRFLDKLARLAPGAERVTDKTTLNYEHLGLISLLFPRARVLHCTRDPLDTCLSCYFQDFGGSYSYIYDLANLGKHYGLYRRLMDHWRRVLDIEILDVSYEAMVSDHETVTRQIVAYCGLEWDDACLRFHTVSRPVLTASTDQVRRPIYTDSVGRHRHYEHHLAPLKAALGTFAR